LDDQAGVVNSQFTFKVYEDVVVFYTVIGALIIVGTIFHFYPPLRIFAAQRIPLIRFKHNSSALQTWLSAVFPRYISYGEASALLSVLGLAIYWMWFWRWGYARIANEVNPSPLPLVCCDPWSSPNSTSNQSMYTTETPITTCATVMDAHGSYQIWARVIGHMSTFFISFTMFPVARYSLWESVFGISYDRAIKVTKLLTNKKI
jgi:hypothetical protein